ncbi:hypothetical protein BU16DRAFT_376339 [Lophium mytilinum]|uniref:Uncharacterized protein n=1 Tax=Lophium mytilinum TaxID=390894 RepID=A0A6A6QWB2_9PEZI|nr:hypothetical protein BU16DRAFT_376339 [Lophium mytilinum]
MPQSPDEHPTPALHSHRHLHHICPPGPEAAPNLHRTSQGRAGTGTGPPNTSNAAKHASTCPPPAQPPGVGSSVTDRPFCAGCPSRRGVAWATEACWRPACHGRPVSSWSAFAALLSACSHTVPTGEG